MQNSGRLLSIGTNGGKATEDLEHNS